MLSIICPAKREQALILHIFLSSEGRLGETETLQRGKAVEKIIIFFCDFPRHVYLALQATMVFHNNCPSTLRTPCKPKNPIEN